MRKNELKIYLASPRGFCAGVDRAIEIVKKSIDKLIFSLRIKDITSIKQI